MSSNEILEKIFIVGMIELQYKISIEIPNVLKNTNIHKL